MLPYKHTTFALSEEDKGAYDTLLDISGTGVMGYIEIPTINISLPVYDKSGREITWTIRESAVSGYVSSTRQNGFTFVLTNTLDKQKLPQTGVLWWPVPILAAAGFAFLITGTFSRKKKDDE